MPNEIIPANKDYTMTLQYLEKANDLEFSIYEQTQLYYKLQNRIKELERGTQRSYEPYEAYDSYLDGKDIIEDLSPIIAGAVIGVIIGAVASITKGILFSYLINGALIGGGVGLAFMIFCFVVTFLSNRDVKKRNAEVDKQNQQIDLINAQQRKFELAQIEILKQQQIKIQNCIKDTRRTLDALYSANIVYPKYRNMVAICTIYEYLCSKRCYSLDGPDGAYNLYETELRLGIIINKLDVVIQKLDKIIENQHMLYQEIRECNARADKISSDMRSMAKSMQNISHNSATSAYNSAVSAYYNRISAQNTEYLKWAKLLQS